MKSNRTENRTAAMGILILILLACFLLLLIADISHARSTPIAAIYPLVSAPYQVVTVTPTIPGPVPPAILGDADGDGRCTEVDALVALKMSVGAQPPNVASMDVDGDGRVSEVDAFQILRSAVSGGVCGTRAAIIPGVPTPFGPPVTPADPPTAPPPGGADSSLIINEVLPSPGQGSSEFVELHNRSASPVRAAGWELTDEDGNTYVIPLTLPDVPPGAFVLVSFDGQGSGLDDLDFGDGLASLHGPPGLSAMLEDDSDQVGLYRSSTRDRTTVVDFMAWGDAPGDRAANAADAGIWSTAEFISLQPSSGRWAGTLQSPPGQSIGLAPGAELGRSSSWALYSNHQVTPGLPNPIPLPYWSEPPDGAAMSADGFAVSWAGQPGASGYRFQMDDDIGFASPEIDEQLDAPHFVLLQPLHAGTYYWRVLSLSSGGDEGPWTSGKRVEVLATPASPVSFRTQGATAALQFGSRRGMASLQLVAPSPPRTGECSVQMFVGGTDRTILSVGSPTELVDGSPIPPGTVIELEVFRSLDEGATYSEPVAVFRTLQGTQRPVEVVVPADTQGNPREQIVTFTAVTPVDCIEPRVVYLSVRSMANGVPGPFENRFLSFRYAIPGPPQTDADPTRDCYPLLIRYETIEDARQGIDRGLCPGATPTPTPTPTATPTGAPAALPGKVLPVPWLKQKKDTRLLCLDGCREGDPSSDIEEAAWDAVHPDALGPAGLHGSDNCCRASMAMINRFYGGTVTQDRLSYEKMERGGLPIDRTAVQVGNPFSDLGHQVGEGSSTELGELFAWALGVPSGQITYMCWNRPVLPAADQPGCVPGVPGKPSFEQIRSFIDEGRPAIRCKWHSRVPGSLGGAHCTVIHGYRVLDDGTEQVYVLNPWTTSRSVIWVYDNPAFFVDEIWVGPSTVSSPRLDEPQIAQDSDGDGIMDWDETARFGTDPALSDSDDDWQLDKQDLRERIFLDAPNAQPMAGRQLAAWTDRDGDGAVKELDDDNDNGGIWDGCEDRDLDGWNDGGETWNFNADDDDDPVNDDCEMGLAVLVGPCDEHNEADAAILVTDNTPDQRAPITLVQLLLDGTEVHNSGPINTDRYEQMVRITIEPPDRQHLLVLQGYNSEHYRAAPKELEQQVSCSRVLTGTASASRLFSIDNSGSMSGGKIDAAKRAAHSALSALPADTEVAVQFFGASGCNVSIVQDFTLDHAAAHSAIDGAVAGGSTPLAAAIRQAGTYMRQNSNSGDRDIILLTDGIETCEDGSAPVDAAGQLNAPATSSRRSPGMARSMPPFGVMPAQMLQGSPASMRLHVIGFGIAQGSSEEQQLMDIATAGGGRYYPAGDEAELTQALTQAATQPSTPSGDGNGDGRCTEVDAFIALRMAVGLQPSDQAKMDVSGDGQVTEIDALQILRWAVSGGVCGTAPPVPPSGQPPGPPSQPPQPPAAGGPQIIALEPAAASVGDRVIVRGTGFGAQGELTLNSMPLDGADIIQWSDSEVTFQVPVGALSGPVRVVTTTGGNAVHLDVLSSFTQAQPSDIQIDSSGIERVKSQVMIGFRPGTLQPTVDQAISSIGGTVIGYDSRLDVYQVEITGADGAAVDQAVATLNARPEVEFSGPRFGSVGIQPPPDDTEYPPGAWGTGSTEQRSWGHRFMRMPEAWDAVQGNRAVRLAVVDNGFLFTHPDLRLNVPIPPALNDLRWSQETTSGGLVWKLQEHGTHVAGIAGAVGNNAFGVAGVSWQVGLMLYDWDLGLGSGTWDRIAGRMIDAIDDGARVINLSAGINWWSIKNQATVVPTDLTPADLAFVNTVHQMVTRALRHAVRTNRDVLVTFAAGNDSLPTTYNGTSRTVTQFPNVMVVAALQEDQGPPQRPGIRADFSNYGPLVNIAAPGHNIYSTIPAYTVPGAPISPSYGRKSGTSMAAPAVAGLAALTWSGNPGLSAAQVKDCILAGAQTRGRVVQEVHNQAFGPHSFYSVDAAETLRECRSIQAQPPVAPVPPWKQPAVKACIDRWLRLVTDWLDQSKPGLAPHRVDQYGHLWNKAVIWAGPPDDWNSRWEGDRYKRIWFLWRPPPGSGIPPLQTYCGGEVDNTPVPVPPAPGPAPGAEPWNDPNTKACIDRWMQDTLACANRTWPDESPFRWTQYGLLINKNTRQDQPPINWGTRYEGNRYKWTWLEYDARVACPGVRSVHDYCSGTGASGGQPPSGGSGQPAPSAVPGQPAPSPAPGQPAPSVVPSPAVPGGGPIPFPGSVSYSRLLSIDNSGSMSGSKIEEAKRAALSTVASLPAGAEVALQFFGTSGCNVELVLGFTTDKNAMSAQIQNAGAHGSTPLALAIEEAGAYLKANAHSSERTIVLLTDGNETCGGDPVEAARKLNAPVLQSSVSQHAPELTATGPLGGLLSPVVNALGQLWRARAVQAQVPPIRLHVIGFGIQPGSTSELELQRIAAAGQGRYFPAGTEAELTQALHQAAAQPASVMGDADGDGRCTEADALVALQMGVGLGTSPASHMDVDGDGRVTEIDALRILMWAVAGGQCGTIGPQP